MSSDQLEKLEHLIGQELTDDVRREIDALWEGFIQDENQDTFSVEDHDATRLNIYLDENRKIIQFKVG